MDDLKEKELTELIVNMDSETLLEVINSKDVSLEFLEKVYSILKKKLDTLSYTTKRKEEILDQIESQDLHPGNPEFDELMKEYFSFD